jgi:hypothetical protein
MTKNKWLTDDGEILDSLLADEAKNADMLKAMLNTIQQLQAKSSFRLALINTLRETHHKTKETNENTGKKEIR